MTTNSFQTSRLGIKGHSPSTLDANGYCEVPVTELGSLPASDISRLRGRVVILCGLRELRNDCWAEIEEWTQHLTPLAIVWNLPPQFPLWGDPGELLAMIREKKLSPEIHHFDAPFPLKGIWSRPQNLVHDPLAPEAMALDQTLAHSNYWRIHGWHPDRWVRLYGPSQIHDLAMSIKHYRPAFVTLAHSQREKQFFELCEALGSDIEPGA